MPNEMNWLLPGRLALTSRPGYPDRPGVEGYAEAYRRDVATRIGSGIRVLWSFLTDQDMTRYDLGGLEAELASHGVTLRRSPITDFHPPTLPQVAAFVAQLDRDLAAGPVALSCSAGLGRTGTMASCYLVSQGETAAAAIIRVRQARPGSLDTTDQEDLVAEYAQSRQHASG
jgi:protein-tyrosine phosphatase